MSNWLIASILAVQPATPQESCDFNAFVREQQVKRDALTGQVREMLETSRSITERRLAISERLIELSEGQFRIKGTFDPNYNADSLRARDQALADQLSLIRQRAEFVQAELGLLTLERDSFHDRCGTSQ